jgi:hypothetical protein
MDTSKPITVLLISHTQVTRAPKRKSRSEHQKTDCITAWACLLPPGRSGVRSCLPPSQSHSWRVFCHKAKVRASYQWGSLSARDSQGLHIKGSAQTWTGSRRPSAHQHQVSTSHLLNTDRKAHSWETDLGTYQRPPSPSHSLQLKPGYGPNSKGSSWQRQKLQPSARLCWTAPRHQPPSVAGHRTWDTPFPLCSPQEHPAEMSAGVWDCRVPSVHVLQGHACSWLCSPCLRVPGAPYHIHKGGRSKSSLFSQIATVLVRLQKTHA